MTFSDRLAMAERLALFTGEESADWFVFLTSLGMGEYED